MADYSKLDINNIARIGLIFLDGDSLEGVMLDPYGPTDYDFNLFNDCKKTIMKIERINPQVDISVFLWQKRADNPNFVLPVIAGKQLPITGWLKTPMTDSMRSAFGGGFGTIENRPEGGKSYFYPVRNSDAEIIGVMELLTGDAPVIDI